MTPHDAMDNKDLRIAKLPQRDWILRFCYRS